jgi:hypothetical protein
MEDSLRVPAAERLDHKLMVNNPFTTRQAAGLEGSCESRETCGLRLRVRLVIHLDEFFHGNVGVDLSR